MQVVADSDEELDKEYVMLDSDFELDNESCASTVASSPPLNASDKLPRRRQKIHLCTFEDCDKVFDRKARLEDHLRSHKNERNFTCPHSPCTKTFLRDSHLKHHIKNQHSEVRDYKCTWAGCESSFTTATRLRRHVAAHEAKEQFKCRGFHNCDQIFRKQETLDRHILTVHQGIRPFPCKELDSVTGEPCNKSYDTAENLRSHVRAKHDITRFSCEECKAYNSSILADYEDNESTVVLRITQFATYALFQEHNAVFHPPTCHLCPTSFVTAKELTRHLELQHGILPPGSTNKDPNGDLGPPVLNCTVAGCTKKFTKRGNLNVHIKTVHENKRDFVCGQTPLPLQNDTDGQPVSITVHGCGRSFTSKASLEEHVRTAHLDLPSKRMLRKKNKRKADDNVFDNDRAQKKRKPRSDRGVPRYSIIDNLTGAEEEIPYVSAISGLVEVHEGPFPFGVEEKFEHRAEAAGQPLSSPAPVVVPEITNPNAWLGPETTIFEDHIYNDGIAYHYPSGEYPTLLTINPAPITDVSYQDDVNFFGEFEQDIDEMEFDGASSYPTL